MGLSMSTLAPRKKSVVRRSTCRSVHLSVGPPVGLSVVTRERGDVGARGGLGARAVASEGCGEVSREGGGARAVVSPRRPFLSVSAAALGAFHV